MKKTNWCVITGAPSSGKTTIINALSVLGYQTAPEIARNYLGYLLNQNPHEYESLRSEITVQSKIIELKLKRERQLCPEDLIFFDRGVPDSLAYFRYYNIDTDKMIEKMNIYQYAWVFFLEGLPVQQDEIRRENEHQARRIGDYIYNAYTELGYSVIRIPPDTVEHRIEQILSEIPAELKTT